MDRRAREAADRVRRRLDCPTSCQLGNTWMPEFAALGALEPLDERMSRVARRSPRDDYFAGIWDTNVDRRQALRRALVRRHARALLPHATCSRRPAIAAPPRDWAEWRARCSRDQARWRARSSYAMLLPLNEFEPLLASRCSRPIRCCATAARYGNFRSAGFRRALDVLRRACSASGSRRRSSNTQISNVWDEFARGYLRVLHHRARGTSASSSAACRAELQDDWMTAPLPGPDGPGRLDRRRLEPGRLPSARRRKDAAWKLIEFLSRARACSSASTRSPATCRRGAAPGTTPALANDRATPGVPRAARARARRRRRCPSGSASLQEMQLAAERVVRGDARPSTRRCAQLDARVDAHAREAPLDAGAGDAAHDEAAERARAGCSSRRRWS